MIIISLFLRIISIIDFPTIIYKLRMNTLPNKLIGSKIIMYFQNRFNGEPTDKVKIHISESDLNLYALPYVNPETMFFGTHLKYEKDSMNYRIKYVKAGNIITV
ncbi:hypothetical protein DV872_18240 [Oceanispirochaeta sp. M1]|nr:hypothetical protein DV872_18240 [Oceanispirochaeta sp. M1]